MRSVEALVLAGVAAACYGTAWLWLLMAVDAWRRRHVPGLVALAAAGAATAALGAYGARLPLHPLAYLPIAAGVAAAYYALVPHQQDDWKRRKLRREDGRQIALHLILATGCVLFSLPYLWMVLTSLKPDEAIFRNPTALPEVWKWSNYPRTLQFLEVALGKVRTGFGSLFFINTLHVTALSMFGMIFSSSLVAYSFARLRWPGRDILFLVLLGTMMLPEAVTMIPRFIIFRQLGWVDTLTPLWIPAFFAGAFNVFLLRQFMLTIPTELEDAAKIDGCGYFTIYWQVMLPLIKPAIAALAIMHFLATWNDFLHPLIYLSSPEKMTGSYALRLFQSANSGEWALLLCAATLWTLPVLVLFFFAQRAFIQGITLTGMKN
jgi:ABC-type glycerol-3-phosphate transport system permease component